MSRVTKLIILFVGRIQPTGELCIGRRLSSASDHGILVMHKCSCLVVLPDNNTARTGTRGSGNSLDEGCRGRAVSHSKNRPPKMRKLSAAQTRLWATFETDRTAVGERRKIDCRGRTAEDDVNKKLVVSLWCVGLLCHCHTVHGHRRCRELRLQTFLVHLLSPQLNVILAAVF